MKLNGKVAIVTGSGSGMGAAIAGLMAAEGASVVVADYNGEGADGVADKIRSDGGVAMAVRVDVSKAADVKRMIMTAVETFGKLDILVNNAGIAGKLFDDLTEEDFRRMLDVNLTGVFLGCKYAVPEMRKQGGGNIVNTASIAAYKAFGPMPDYNASKAGVLMLTKTLAAQLGKDNIRVNCICPGPIETALSSAFRLNPQTEAEEEELRAASRARVPLGWIGEPRHVAPAVVFLASDDAAFITGVVLPIDGGLSA